MQEPDPLLQEPGGLRRVVTIVVALALPLGLIALLAAAVIGNRDTPTGPIPRGYPEPPHDGYYVMFPEEAEAADDFGAHVAALTNLPDGTLVSIQTTNEGTCCPAVEEGRIDLTTSDGTCYGLVGAIGTSTGFEVTIIARPDIDLQMPGPFDGGDWEPPEQPEAVLATLGERFEHLTGNQVVVQEDGSKHLVATASYPWPEPSCGGKPLPLFGGEDCVAAEGQLQGSSLEEAMTEVMGALTQARMCEFWGLMLPPEVAAEHPWADFAREWRAWFLDPPKDFSDARSNAGWTDEPVTWHEMRRDGEVHIIAVTDHGERVATLELTPLPAYCPRCDANVVPFWGVTEWSFA
jgi:hypothetical protein